MLPVKDQLSILVRLSQVDHNMAEEERKLINAVGKRNGLSPEEIDEIIDDPNEIVRLLDLPSNEKFDYLYMIIQLMKIDKKVHNSEIEFCEKIAMKLGYKPGVIADLSAFIYSDPTLITDPKHLKSIAEKQLLYRAEDQ